MFDQDMAGFVVVAIIVGFIGLLCYAANEEGKHQERFMADCMQDHKQYECDALWRAGEDHTTVMPVPIYVGK